MLPQATAVHGVVLQTTFALLQPERRQRLVVLLRREQHFTIRRGSGGDEIIIFGIINDSIDGIFAISGRLSFIDDVCDLTSESRLFAVDDSRHASRGQ